MDPASCMDAPGAIIVSMCGISKGLAVPEALSIC